MFSQNERRKADLQDIESDFLILASGLMIFQSLVIIYPVFRLRKTITLSPWAKIKNTRERFVAMSKMNNWAKFHGDIPSGYNPTSKIELSEMVMFCLQFWKETLHMEATSVAHLTKFSLIFFMRFSQKMPVFCKAYEHWSLWRLGITSPNFANLKGSRKSGGKIKTGAGSRWLNGHNVRAQLQIRKPWAGFDPQPGKLNFLSLILLP